MKGLDCFLMAVESAKKGALNQCINQFEDLFPSPFNG